ncbi:hypothetical protein C8J57DRAFT_1516027 [Mycena rebaudengoi]|nr:hypothetical protein C8J57DRAFT_1516027 [Mycena rebaudengoi]
MHSGPVESDHYYFRTLPEDLGLPSRASRCSVRIILHYSHSPPSSCLLLLFLQSSRLAIDPVPCPVLALLRVRITLQAFPHSPEYNPVLLLAFVHPPALIRLGPSSTIPPIPCICPHFLPPSQSTFWCHHQISGPSSGSFLYEPSRMMSHYASRSSYIHAHVLSLFTDLPSPLPSHPVTLRSLRPSTGSVTGLRPPDHTSPALTGHVLRHPVIRTSGRLPSTSSLHSDVLVKPALVTPPLLRTPGLLVTPVTR